MGGSGSSMSSRPLAGRYCGCRYGNGALFHHWLANRMREEGIDFQQCANAFTRCAKPERLQQLANSLTPWDLLRCGQKWLARLTPFLYRQGAAGIRLPASTILLAGRVLRQPHLPAPHGTGQTR